LMGVVVGAAWAGAIFRQAAHKEAASATQRKAGKCMKVSG
jgi:hypothetical protein